MKTIRLHDFLASAVFVMAVSAAAWHVPAAAQGAATTQTTVERGVTVKVTPKTLSGTEWEFAVVLDTHAEDLKDDLEKAAVLLVDGREMRPSQWQGPGAGGCIGNLPGMDGEGFGFEMAFRHGGGLCVEL